MGGTSPSAFAALNMLKGKKPAHSPQSIQYHLLLYDILLAIPSDSLQPLLDILFFLTERFRHKLHIIYLSLLIRIEGSCEFAERGEEVGHGGGIGGIGSGDHPTWPGSWRVERCMSVVVSRSGIVLIDLTIHGSNESYFSTVCVWFGREPLPEEDARYTHGEAQDQPMSFLLDHSSSSTPHSLSPLFTESRSGLKLPLTNGNRRVKIC
jgi:hypothetical protein